MRIARRILISVTASLLGFNAAVAADSFDLVIRHGRVIDGAGNPSFHADVAIQDGRIAAVGRITNSGTIEFDATGLVIAPGFIDVHTHGEKVLSLPRAENFVRMGVTTIVAGNCGSSVDDVDRFLNRITTTRVSVNVATLIGHGTVREKAMGGSFNRPPSESEMESMKRMVAEGMNAGAVGLSTGLIYLPGSFAKPNEIIELAKVAAEFDGIYASHMRNEGSDILRALDEVFAVARGAKIRAQVSHIKLGGKAAWGRAQQVLDSIEAARAGGLDITQDQYVYTASSTGFSSLIPDEAREGKLSDFRTLLQDPKQKDTILSQMKSSLLRRGQESYAHAMVADYPADRSLNGLSLPEASRQRWGTDSLDAQIELILEMHLNGGASGVFHGINEADLQEFLRHSNTMIASDSGVRESSEGLPHPRGYGNNARVLGRYVRELKVLRLEDAIRRMTSLPAAAFRLPDRGLVSLGHWADLVVFDPNTVCDQATFEVPHQFPEGIRHVLVNGIPVSRDGEHTDARPGQAVRRGKGVRQ